MFKQLKELLPKTFNQHGLGSQVEAIKVLNAYKKYCLEMLGEEALLNLYPRYFKQNILYIDASSAAWAQHLHVKQTALLEKINSALDNNSVSKFFIQIKNKA